MIRNHGGKLSMIKYVYKYVYIYIHAYIHHNQLLCVSLPRSHDHLYGKNKGEKQTKFSSRQFIQLP